MSFDLGSIIPTVVSAAVTSFTGNPLLGQLAADFASSILTDSGSTGNAGFDSVFNSSWGNAVMAAVD